MLQIPETRQAVAMVTAGAILLSGLLPASATPVMISAAGLEAAPNHSVDVRWRGRGGAVIGGIAAGLAIGAIAGAASRPRYYAPDYAYGEPYYAPPAVVYAPPPAVYYEPAPTFYAPQAFAPGPTRQCWVATDDRGFGYWRPC